MDFLFRLFSSFLVSFVSFVSIIATMADRIKLLQFIQKVYQFMGIYPSQSNQNWCSINWRNIFILFSLIQMFTFSFAFLIFEAKNIIDVETSFYTVTTEICCTSYYLIHMWKMPKILKLCENFEKFMGKSKC